MRILVWILFMGLFSSVYAKDVLLQAEQAYANGKYIQAKKILKRAAHKGNVLAQVNLGFMYENGKGIPKAYDKALF